MRFCLFMGASNGNQPEFSDAAQATGKILASKGIGVVYGGGDIGLMGKMANAVIEQNGEVIGVIPNRLKWVEMMPDQRVEMTYVESLEERKTIMLEQSDAFLALPGGIGTMDEIMTVIAWNELKYQNKPLGLLNTLGFYDTFIDLLRHQKKFGFLHDEQLIEKIFIDENTEALIDSLSQAARSK